MIHRIPFLAIVLVLASAGSRSDAALAVPRVAKAEVRSADGIVVENQGVAWVSSGQITNPYPLGLILRNSGKADLSGLQLEVSGANADEFAVGPWKRAILKPGKSMPLPLRCLPREAGQKQVTLRLASNDPATPVLEFRLSFGLTPGPRLTIANFPGADLPSGSVQEFGSQRGGGITSTMLQIQNIGGASLEKIKVRVSGPHSRDFTVSKWTTKILYRFGYQRIDVDFSPGGPGERTATLSISGKGYGPYEIVLRGQGSPAPHLEVPAAATGIDFGRLAPGKSARRKFVVRNTGFSVFEYVSVTAVGSPGVNIDPASLLFSLGPGESRSVSLRYTHTGASAQGGIALSTSESPHITTGVSWTAGSRTRSPSRFALAVEAPADGNGNGIDDLLDTAFDLENRGVTEGLPRIRLGSDAGSRTLRFEYLRRTDGSLLYRPEVSTDLLDFKPVTSPEVCEGIGAGWERVVVEHPVTGQARLFGRVSVTPR